MIRLYSILFICLLFSSCGNEGKKSSARIVPSKGLPSELLLVVDRPVWESDLADTLKSITEEPIEGLPQPEPRFRVVHILSPYYKRSYTTMHSKLFIELDKTQKVPMIGISYDVVARPQIEVTVKGGTLDQLRSFLSTNRTLIQDLIADAQIDMRALSLHKKYSQKTYKEAENIFGIHIFAPEQIRATKKRENFLWAGTNLNEKDQNIVIYSYPWDGTEIRTATYFSQKRDSVMQRNIPGSEPGQWMQTTRNNNIPVVLSRIRNISGREVHEVRGLWEMRNGAMGGPFVSYTHIDTLNQRVLVTEGFVYSPSTDKRELIRQLEASLRTIKFLQKTSSVSEN